MKDAKCYSIQVTILLENALWVGVFERNDVEHYAAARHIFGSEPTDAEIYVFISDNYQLLRFTEPHEFKLAIKRKNPKRMQREVKQEMQKAKTSLPRETYAQETLRIDLEKNKKLKKIISKAEKETQLKKKFLERQAKKQKKHRGH